MRYILLLGAAYNLIGSWPLFLAAKRTLASAPGPADKSLNLVLFSAGTAIVFGSLYLYLFLNPSFVVPFLVFGASLKTWAFLLSCYLYFKRRASRDTLIQFGLGNGIIAALFWAYIFTNA